MLRPEFESLDAIWESSRHNSWSFALPLILNIGTAILIVIAFVQPTWLRWTLNVFAVLAMGYFAIEYSSMEIEEKWRIRSEWGKANHDSLTESDRFAVTVDGANRVLGPILVGGKSAAIRAGLVLLGLAVSRFVLVRLRKILATKREAETTFPPNDVDSTSDADNAYAPPNTAAIGKAP